MVCRNIYLWRSFIREGYTTATLIVHRPAGLDLVLRGRRRGAAGLLCDPERCGSAGGLCAGQRAGAAPQPAAGAPDQTPPAGDQRRHGAGAGGGRAAGDRPG